jgi:DNA-binding Xre family transcriptional regulator
VAPERTRVVNIRDLPPGPLPADHVYIGRAIPRARLVASKWGNPFKLGQHGDRDQVIARYEAWRAPAREIAGDFRRACVGLGDELRRLRRARGFSQRELAGRADLTDRFISALERGDQGQAIRATSLYRLASALGCRMEDLLGVPRLLGRHGDPPTAARPRT